MPTVEKAFGQVIKALRLKRKLTHLQVAERSDLDVTYISLLERGKSQPTLKSFFKLCAALETSPTLVIRRTLKSMGAKD